MTRLSELVDCGNGIRLERGVRVKMADGVQLVADHYYPAGGGPFPTLLMRQPYGRAIASTVVYAHPVWFARNGYHVVIQDVRGRGDSEGEFYPFRDEGADGKATIEWLGSHPANNGRIGMYGFSYQGMTQLLAAAEQPRGLAAIAPGMTAHDLYHGWFYHQGAFRLSTTMGWGLQMVREDVRRQGNEGLADRLENAWLNPRSLATAAPYANQPLLKEPGLPAYWKDWIEHSEWDDYWKSIDLSERLHRVRLPALHLSGWYDYYLSGSIQLFLQMQKQGVPDQYLLAGPWIHLPWGDRAGEATFGTEAVWDTDLHLLRWFNHWLKETGEFSQEPAIRHFVLGTNTWETVDCWPENETPLYLHSQGRANSRKGDGILNGKVPTLDEPRDFFVYDPEVPVFAPGGALAVAGPYDQGAVEQGNNLLVYTSAELTDSWLVFGTPRIVLYAATSAETADFTAKLVRVTESGRNEFICLGIARSGWLFRSYQADLLTRWEFALEPTSCRFGRGERIRLEIASSAFPLYDRNPGQRLAPGLAGPRDWRRSTQMVAHEQEYPSAFYLPCLEKGVFAN